MAEDETKTEVTEEVNGIPKAFDDAMSAIDAENKAEAKAVEDDTVPAGTEQGDEVSETGEELVEEETPAGEDVKGELSVEDTEVLNNIDPDVLECCRDYGWDNNKIVQMAQMSPELLDDVRELLIEESKETEAPAKQEKPPQKKEELESKVDEIDGLIAKLDPDVHGQEVVNVLKSIAERQVQGSKILTEEQQKLQSERNEAFNVRVDDCFDRFSKSIPDLGKAEKLNKRQYMLRAELFEHAGVTARMRKVPLEKAIEIEVNKYKNQGGEKTAGQKLLNKLDKQKKRFTNPPTRRHSDVKSRKFATEEEKKETIMTEAYKEAGIEE